MGIGPWAAVIENNENDRILRSMMNFVKRPKRSEVSAEIIKIVINWWLRGYHRLNFDEKGGDSDVEGDDLIFVSQSVPSNEQMERAKKLGLPPTFFLYENQKQKDPKINKSCEVVDLEDDEDDKEMKEEPESDQ